jgi:PKHD-type hydroxylase
MLIIVPDILDAERLAAAQSVLKQGNFIDGKLSAGSQASRAKHNEELSNDENVLEALNNVVMTGLVQHPVYLNAALPLKIAQPIYARYSQGMSYGYHVDDPLMGAIPRYRSDLSISVFLSDPEDYDGGELCIDTNFGHEQIKLPAGHAVIYPSSSRHSVNEVTSGERYVAITWLQSMIRNPEQRQLLFQMYQARELLKDSAEQDAYEKLNDSYANLVRMWAEL